MKKNLLILLTLAFVSVSLVGQIAPNKYYVQFTDKNDSPYSLNSPEEFLTTKGSRQAC